MDFFLQRTNVLAQIFDMNSMNMLSLCICFCWVLSTSLTTTTTLHTLSPLRGSRVPLNRLSGVPSAHAHTEQLRYAEQSVVEFQKSRYHDNGSDIKP